jgi:two-component system chemotaxis response regulator CheB
VSIMHLEAIVIGASAGGLSALKSIFAHLPPEFRVPLIIVQHQPADFGDALALSLNRQCPVPVKEADEKEAVLPGKAYLAPANYHLLIEDDRTFSLSVDERVNFSRPSIDVLFETAAEVYRSGLMGIILTGASEDGSRGLKAVKDHGGLTLVQDPRSAEAEAMPLAAINTADPDLVLPLTEIGPYIMGLIGGSIVRS